MKLFATDMDGTFLDDQKQIPIKNLHLLEQLKKKDYKIAVCTGRPLDGIFMYFLNSDGLVDYYVANNGSVIFDVKKEKIISEKSISMSDIKLLLDFSNKMELDIHFITRDHIVNYKKKVGIYMALDAYLVNMEIHFKDFDSYSNEVILKALITGEEEIIAKIETEIPKELQMVFNFTLSAKNNIDVTYNDTSKGNAIKLIQELNGIMKNDTVAIGDQKNDISMFESSGLSIAMENSHEDVKSRADIIGPNNNNGLYNLLEIL